MLYRSFLMSISAGAGFGSCVTNFELSPFVLIFRFQDPLFDLCSNNISTTSFRWVNHKHVSRDKRPGPLEPDTLLLGREIKPISNRTHNLKFGVFPVEPATSVDIVVIKINLSSISKCIHIRFASDSKDQNN